MSIPVVRAQHLIHYIEVLRDAGVPVERALKRSRLPVSIEQTPDAYVSLPRALDWVWRSSREVGIMELGFLAGRRTSIGTLHPDVQRAVIGAPTGFARVAAADIAFSAGYDNAPHFCRAFKRLTGMTPRDYRRSLA